MSSDRYMGNFGAGEDWQCDDCGYVNWARRQSCNNFRCNAPRPRSGSRHNFGNTSKYRTRRNVDDGNKQQNKKPRLSDESKPKIDEFDVFGKSVSAQLKKLSVEEAVMAQVKIQTVLAECRVNDVKKGYTAPDSDSCHVSSDNGTDKTTDVKESNNGTQKEEELCDVPSESSIENLLTDNV